MKGLKGRPWKAILGRWSRIVTLLEGQNDCFEEKVTDRDGWAKGESPLVSQEASANSLLVWMRA